MSKIADIQREYYVKPISETEYHVYYDEWCLQGKILVFPEEKICLGRRWALDDRYDNIIRKFNSATEAENWIECDIISHKLKKEEEQRKLDFQDKMKPYRYPRIEQ